MQSFQICLSFLLHITKIVITLEFYYDFFWVTDMEDKRCSGCAFSFIRMASWAYFHISAAYRWITDKCWITKLLFISTISPFFFTETVLNLLNNLHANHSELLYISIKWIKKITRSYFFKTQHLSRYIVQACICWQMNLSSMFIILVL